MRKDITIQYIATEELRLNARNPRKNDMAVDTVAKSIEKYGFKNPIIADSALVVYCGNTRLKAARKLGLKTVPVIVADDLTAKEIRELAIIDNKSSEIAEWDMDMLADELSDLDLDDFNLDFEIDEGKEEITEDTPPEVDEEHEPICQLGDIWQLGEHRLMCGDSTDKATVEKLMNGEKADMVFTDPPYGMSAVSKSGVLSKHYKNDIIGDEDNTTAINAFNLVNKMFNGAKQVWFGANYYTECLPSSECWIVWDKNNGASDQTDCELAWTNFRSVVRMFTQSSEKLNRVHPTQKPIRLIVDIFNKFDNRNELKNVLDLFGGSGSTLIACEQLGRRCYTMELDPKYCDVIIKRWENLTGKKAVRYGTSS